MDALEALGQRLLAEGRTAEAIRAARAAMRIDPLRESPHALLIRIHLTDGNQSEAVGVFDRYRAILFTALDLEPTGQLFGLVADLHR
jgi:DNA-binding SARP family transcriptional activator